jgi:tetratricopeptide (TPR) repeat protein
MTLEALDRPVEALDAVDAAERTGVAEPSLWLLRGDLLLALGRELEAIPQYKRALAEGPDELTDNLVQRLEETAYDMARDRPDDALNLLAALKDAGKLSPSGRGLYAETLRLKDKLELAVTEADRALREGADAGWVAGTKAQALVDLYRSAEALEVLEGTGHVDPEDRFNESVRINALLNLDRTLAADGLLRQHFPVSDQPEPDGEPDEFLTWSVGERGRILIDLGQFEEASARIRRYTRSYGHQTEWDYWIAVSYNRRTHYDRALPLLSRNTDEWGDDGLWVWNELGDALVASGGRLSREARDAYERAARSGFEGPLALVTQAWARFRLGDMPGAAETYRRALNSATDPLREHRLRLVLVHHAAGNHTAGAEMLREELRDLANLPDPQRAGGILSEGIYAVNLVGNDPEYGPPSAQVWRELRETLEASQRAC